MPKKKFWTFKNQAEDKPAELLLYGPIESASWWGDEITPKQFKADLDALGNIETLNIYINSDGGDVFAGQAIYSMLKRHQAQKNVYVDGLAASIASVVAMAGDTVYMPSNAMMMVHNPWSIAMGYADDFRKLAEDLDKIRESIIAVYEAKTSLSRDEIVELMDAETWLTADDALTFGFADEIEESKQVAASLNAGILTINGQEMDLKRYRNPPKLLVTQPEKPKHEEKQAENLLSLFDLQMSVKRKKYLGGIR
ncbi:MAG: head maturation protease, ClpP-related [Eubacteriales bacterium]|jgi:ATP-dependent Clp protease protease subunit